MIALISTGMSSEPQNVWAVLCARSVMLELLWRPIPELLSALDVDGAAEYALSGAGAAEAPHSGAAVRA